MSFSVYIRGWREELKWSLAREQLMLEDVLRSWVAPGSQSLSLVGLKETRNVLLSYIPVAL